MPLVLIGVAVGAAGTWWATGTTEKLVKIVLVGGVAYVVWRKVSA